MQLLLITQRGDDFFATGAPQEIGFRGFHGQVERLGGGTIAIEPSQSVTAAVNDSATWTYDQRDLTIGGSFTSIRVDGQEFIPTRWTSRETERGLLLAFIAGLGVWVLIQVLILPAVRVLREFLMVRPRGD